MSTALICLAALAAGCGAQAGSELVVSSDRELRRLAAEVLPDIAERSGMELKVPVRLEVRTRDELERYLEFKLDEELPPEEAQARVDVYAMLGLLDPDTDLRALLLGLYGEQVAGFYEPDSTAFFVIEGQSVATLRPLLVHELVHAVQDQSVDLRALSDSDLGNDRATAAMAAIEGHATLVMFEYLAEQMAGTPLDLATVSDFAAQIRPALEATAQFPALASAPRIIRESLLFPYVEGAIFAHGLWSETDRVVPFGDAMPLSTEQVFDPAAASPVELAVEVSGATQVLTDVLGSLELGILIEDVLGVAKGAGGRAGGMADGWDGDRFVLVDVAGEGRALSFVTLWDSEKARDAFSNRVEVRGEHFGAVPRVERTSIEGHPASILSVGPDFSAHFTLAASR
ncbi:MAG: hypothetical protein OSA81_09940 [Longimicrobiales bacterium]|nr:hypothetical protein [Longimicrobiales bacterium]